MKNLNWGCIASILFCALIWAALIYLGWRLL